LRQNELILFLQYGIFFLTTYQFFIPDHYILVFLCPYSYLQSEQYYYKQHSVITIIADTSR
jgi:hypothetical protein